METSIVNKLIVEVYVYLVVLFVINLEKLWLKNILYIKQNFQSSVIEINSFLLVPGRNFV